MEILSQALAQREQTLATNTKLKKIIKDTKRTQKEIDDENSLSVQFKAATTRQQTKRISDLTYLDLNSCIRKGDTDRIRLENECPSNDLHIRTITTSERNG